MVGVGVGKLRVLAPDGKEMILVKRNYQKNPWQFVLSGRVQGVGAGEEPKQG